MYVFIIQICLNQSLYCISRCRQEHSNHSDSPRRLDCSSDLPPYTKCPGVRPIGVGEIPRYIIAMAILRIINKDVVAAAGPRQLCAGQNGGCEASVHTMHKIFQDPGIEAALLVHATNAFNCQAASILYAHLLLKYLLTCIYRSQFGLEMGEISSIQKAPPREIHGQWPCMPLPFLPSSTN